MNKGFSVSNTANYVHNYRSTVVYIASGNPHKIKEIRNILPKDVAVLNDTLGTLHPEGKDVRALDPEETGTSFVENALIKASAYYQAIRSLLPELSFSVLADDSGICVDALEGAPGIYSARYGFDLAAANNSSSANARTDGDAINTATTRALLDSSTGRLDPSIPLYQCKLLQAEMAARATAQTQSNRSARFICCAVLLHNEHNFTSTQASWEGSIITGEPSGSNGFGYDPVFFVPETKCTSAELSAQQKNTLSHRAKAIAGIFHA